MHTAEVAFEARESMMMTLLKRCDASPFRVRERTEIRLRSSTTTQLRLSQFKDRLQVDGQDPGVIVLYCGTRLCPRSLQHSCLNVEAAVSTYMTSNMRTNLEKMTLARLSGRGVPRATERARESSQGIQREFKGKGVQKQLLKESTGYEKRQYRLNHRAYKRRCSDKKIIKRY
jgi:hypothetical protein